MVVVGRRRRTPTAARRSARRCARPRRASPSPRPKWTIGRVDRLLLHVQARAHLDLAADAERVDALIAGRGRRLRPHAPASGSASCRVLVARDGVAVGVEADQLEPAVAVEVGGGADVRGRRRAGERRELPPGRAEQHARRRRAGRRSGRRRRCCRGRRRARRALPAGGRRAVRRRAVRRPRADRPRVSTAIVPSRASASRSNGRVAGRFDRGDGADRAGVGGTGPRWKAPPRRFSSTWTRAGVVEERRVGHAFAVEVGPGEAAHAGDAGERLLRGERAVAVVAQQRRRRRRRREHDVEIAVGVDVGGPDAARPARRRSTPAASSPR